MLELEGERFEDAIPSRQARLVVAYLVLRRGRPVDRGRLTELLWPEGSPPGADTTLRGLVFRLRKALGAGRLEGRSELSLRLPENAWIDVEVARGSAHQAESAIAQQDWRRAWLPSRVAAGIAGTEFMPGHGGEWVAEQRTELAELRLRALECVAETGLNLGGTELGAAERAGRSLIAAAPYRESGYLHLMHALERGDNVAEALRVYDDLRRLLRNELGVSPGARIQQLHERLLGVSAS